MRSLHNDAARREICDRIMTLTPESERQWGTMSHGQVICHMSDALRLALGEIPVGEPKGPLQLAPMRYLVIHRLPWPKGPKGPQEAFTSSPTQFDEDRAMLVRLIERFAATNANELAPLHPIFGRMTLDDWDVLMYRHADHHLRQFNA